MANLIKDNAYQILGLDTSATQKDILKRSKDLAKFIEIDSIPEYDLDLGIFENFRTEDTVKDAIQKLTSPRKQIKEYFFWFSATDDVDEQALGILRKKDPQNAILVWEHHSGDDSTKSLFYKKNLAILYGLLLFKEDNAHYLSTSLKIWHEILTSTKFWGAFSKVYKLNDELNTNQETFDDFQKNAVSYVSDLYTELSQVHKNNKYISEFSSIFNAKGEKTEKTLLAPIFNEMTVAIESIENLKVSDDGIFHKEKSAILKKSILVIQECCNKLKEIGLYEDSQARVIRDRAATALRNVSIELNNKLDETTMALSLGKIADQLSGTEGSKNKIQEDIKDLEKINAQKKHQPVVDAIIDDFKSGNSEAAIAKINGYIYNENTDPELKNMLKELKDAMEERITKSGKPVSSTPPLFTIWGFGTMLYGDTLYLTGLYVPVVPLARYNVTQNGKRYSFHGKLELTNAQKWWKWIAIIAIVVVIIVTISGSN